MKSVLLLVAVCACSVRCLPPPHPDVLAVRHNEEQLPPNLRKPALRNPHLRQLLFLSSLLHKGEKLVFERETNKIDRQEIYKMLIHAGFIHRNGHSKPNKFPENIDEQNFHDTTYLLAQDLLQYL